MILVDVHDVLASVPTPELPAATRALMDELSNLARGWSTRVAAVLEPAHGIEGAGGARDGGTLGAVRVFHARPGATPSRVAELLLGPLATTDVLVTSSCPRTARLARSCGARVVSSRALWLSLQRPECPVEPRAPAA